MDHISKTQQCYSFHAKHFVETRKKVWPEMKLLSDYIPSSRPLRVLDIGCGGGRLYPILHDIIGKKNVSYTGVDYAQGMIDQANKTNPHATFVCQDMINFLVGCQSGSFDLIIALASLQHIYSMQERIRMFQHMYNVLSYGGRAIVINWSFSYWYLRKYPLQIVGGILQSLWKKNWLRNDYMIPRKGQHGDAVSHRYYHIFTLHEITQLARLSGFSIVYAGYVSRSGTLTQQRTTARNTFLVIEKNIR